MSSKQLEKKSKKRKREYFGKYDVFLKNLEFTAWIKEVIGNELLTENQIERKYYDEFINCYNNCKFPNTMIFINGKQRDYLRSWHTVIDLGKLIIQRLQIENMNFFVKIWILYLTMRRKEKKLLRELESKRKLEDAIFNMNKEKADAMKEIDYKNSLMRHYYQTGNMVAAKDLHKQLVGTKSGPVNEGEPEDFSAPEDLEL